MATSLSPVRRPRGQQVETTRRTILDAAERLFAEHGVFAVSNRQIGEAAGQGNNTAVGYHFGTKTELVRAIIRRHSEPTERIRAELLERHTGSGELSDWVACVVRPFTRHLASLPAPSWYARFAAQLITEPQLRQIAAEELREATLLLTVTDRLHACLPGLPPAVRAERDNMAHLLIVHFCADRERGLPRDPAGAAAIWQDTEIALGDAVRGLYLAAASPRA